MNPALAAVAAITIGGAVIAVSSRDVRTIVLGLFLVLLAAPLIADPWPDPLATLARIAASLLAVRFLAIGLRGQEATHGTRIGWPAESLLAAAGAVVGFGSHGLGAAGLGPAEAQAAGFALLVLAAAPLITGRDVLRLGVGSLLLLVAASLIRAGLKAPAGQSEQLIEALLVIALGGAIAVAATAARASGGLEATDADPNERAWRAPDAHRPTEQELRAANRRRPPTAAAGEAESPEAGPRRAPRAIVRPRPGPPPAPEPPPAEVPAEPPVGERAPEPDRPAEPPSVEAPPAEPAPAETPRRRLRPRSGTDRS